MGSGRSVKKAPLAPQVGNVARSRLDKPSPPPHSPCSRSSLSFLKETFKQGRRVRVVFFFCLLRGLARRFPAMLWRAGQLWGSGLLLFNGEVVPGAPLGPAAVVDRRQLGVRVGRVEGQREDGRRDSRPARLPHPGPPPHRASILEMKQECKEGCNKNHHTPVAASRQQHRAATRGHRRPAGAPWGRPWQYLQRA